MADEALIEEIEKLLKEGTSGGSNKSSKVTGDDQFKDNSNSTSGRVTRKRKGKDALEKEERYISCENSEGYSTEIVTPQNLCKETASDKVNIQNLKFEVYM